MTSAVAQQVTLPSGLQAALHDVVVDEVGSETWLRMRFIAPQLDPTAQDAASFADIEADFTAICSKLGGPYAARHGLAPDKIVVSLADRAVAFGTTDPAATQYFEQFRWDGADCIWESF